MKKSVQETFDNLCEGSLTLDVLKVRKHRYKTQGKKQKYLDVCEAVSRYMFYLSNESSKEGIE